MEKLVEAKVYKVMQFCDKCGEELVFTGEVLLTNPEKYVHRCNYNCWKQCIPYENNEHLFDKTDDCADFYKTWQ